VVRVPVSSAPTRFVGKQHRKWSAVALSAGFIHAPWHGMDLHLTQAEEIALQVEARAKALAGDDLGSEDAEGSEGG
jgi:hypothetical protein